MGSKLLSGYDTCHVQRCILIEKTLLVQTIGSFLRRVVGEAKVQFELIAPYKMSPGQADAVEKLADNFSKKDKQTLLGITGSGKSVISDTDVIIRKNGPSN